MHYQGLILSADKVFARMLELEFSLLQLSVTSLTDWKEGVTASVVLLDLDTATLPPSDCYEHMIGFTRGTVASVGEAGRQCSLVLRRPFEVRLLCREVLNCLHEQSAHFKYERAGDLWFDTTKNAKASKEQVRTEGHRLVWEKKSITLGPHESTVMKCLLEKRGIPVSREEIAAKIGESRTNKTDVYICFLRRKIEEHGIPCRIRTVRNCGYQLD